MKQTNGVPMVLCNAGYYGTLAAVRSLGRAQVPVVTVDPSFLAPGRYSRYSSSHLASPPCERSDAWAEWLLRLGRRGPRRVIYATSDAVSYALARYRSDLEGLYYLYQPDFEATIGILDKGRLIEHAHAVGIETPLTWAPKSIGEARSIARNINTRVIIKPRSQLAVRNYNKGTIAGPYASQILAEYERALHHGAHDPLFAKRHPEIMLPMLQQYQPEAAESVYSLTGFRDITGSHLVVRGAKKVFQQPRRLGTGLCFEASPVDPSLVAAAARLCERIGYYGAFELEFIISGNRPLLIDFNGRFYNQLAFETARGMDLPLLVYAAAIGDEERVAQLVSSTSLDDTPSQLAFLNDFALNMIMSSQRIFGAMSRDEAAYWQDWCKARTGKIVHSTRDASDQMPNYVDMVRQLYGAIRHPRAFMRQMD